MFLFVLAVLGITAMVNVAVIGATTLREPATPAQLIAESVLVSGAVLLMIAAVSTVKTLMLRQGGGVKVAESRRDPGTGYADRPAAQAVPQRRRRDRHRIEHPGAGAVLPARRERHQRVRSRVHPADAAVCVTGGSLERLNRDELQGVIAHEFNHIVNGDMRLSLKLIGVLAGITALSVIGRMLWYSGGGRGRDRGNSLPLWALGLVVLAAGWIGVFFGRLIKAAVSRQREYLADASAVQFTRQTSGLAGALKKIGGLEAGSRLHTPRPKTSATCSSAKA